MEPQEDKAWWSGWWTPPSLQKKESSATQGFTLECEPSVETLTDSAVRCVTHPGGMDMQINSSEPMGAPRLSLHQNHHAATLAPGSSLGSVQMGARDSIAATLSAFVDGAWTPLSHPTGLSARVTPPNSTTARFPAFTVRSDGRMAIGGGPAAMSSPLVSLGVYRRGVFELPSVDKHADLLASHVNGAIVYARDLDKVLISQGGEWRALVTTPVVSGEEETLPDGGWSPEEAPMARVMGAPRKDGRPAVFSQVRHKDK